MWAISEGQDDSSREALLICISVFFWSSCLAMTLTDLGTFSK